MQNGKTDNDRHIIFSILMTDMGSAALPSLLSPQFSHRSPIVFLFQKENWGRTEGGGCVKERTKGSAKGTWVQVEGDSRKRACLERG